MIPRQSGVDPILSVASADLDAKRVMEELRAVCPSDIEDYELRPGGALRVREGAHPLASCAVASKKYTIKRRLALGKDGVETSIGTETTEGEIKLWNKVGGLKLAAEIVGLTDKDQQSVGVRITQIVFNLPPDEEEEKPLPCVPLAVEEVQKGGDPSSRRRSRPSVTKRGFARG